MGGLSLWHWLVVLVVVVLVFGTRRLRNVGQDLGEAVKGFRKGMRDGDAPGDAPDSAQWHSVKAELERDLAAEELQRSLREGREELRRAGDELRAVERDATGRGTTGRDDAARGDGERPDDRG